MDRMINNDIYNKTYHEKLMQDMLKRATDFPVMGVTYSYKAFFEIIQKHLYTMYGDMADWNRNLGIYLQSEERRNLTIFIEKIKDVQEIPLFVLEEAIEQEKENYKLLMTAIRLFDIWEKDKYVDNLAKAAEILGVLPLVDVGSVINNYYVIFPVDGTARKELRNHILKEHENLLGMVVRLLVRIYQDGDMISYPFVGTMITQLRGKCFWRGENAFYGSSKPSIYRVGSQLSPNVIDAVIRMRYDECGFFLDNFESVRNWNTRYGNVNYMALMQHYGLPTHMMDVTSDIKTALFFACCKWDNNGAFSRWKPLTKADFEHKDSRAFIAKLGGDSRYGLIYKERADIEDLMWCVVNSPKDCNGNNDTFLQAMNHIIPVGYQPFGRCKAQHAYMLLGKTDLYLDSHFDKAKFRLDEDFCNWIYEEMDGGDKIYPYNDVPDITKYIGKIAQTKVFSKSIFDSYCEHRNIEKSRLKHELLVAGFFVSDSEISYISDDELRKINTEYTLDKAFSIADVDIKNYPLFMI